MFLNLFKKGISAVKELHEMAFFAVMADEDIFFIFSGSPIYFVMLPLIGMLATVQALINGFELSKANNKNFDRWLGVVVSAVCATLTSISLYGLAIASYYELSFALGPWFFLASIGVALTQQLTLFSLNCYRAYEALSNSAQRMHYVQAALNNLFQVGLLATVVGALTFVMLTPVAPALGSAFAIAAVSMSALHMLWRIMPSSWRAKIKAHLDLDKPKFGEDNVYTEPLTDELRKKLNSEPDHSYQRLFTKRDYAAEIQHKTYDQGVLYLQRVIQEKINIYTNKPIPLSEKDEQKKTLLLKLLPTIDADTSFTKKQILKFYPLAFQSFFVEKSEVEQIVDAALLLQEKHQEEQIKLEGLSTCQLVV